MEFILRKLARCIHVTFFLIIFFSSKIVYSGEVTMPTSLTTDTTDFVLLYCKRRLFKLSKIRVRF